MREHLRYQTLERALPSQPGTMQAAVSPGIVEQPRAAARPELRPRLQWRQRIHVVPRVLIVTAEDGLAATLSLSLRQAGILTERVETLSKAVDAASSGRFSVVVTVPQTRDGSWRQLAATARRCRSPFSIIVMARTFDLGDWAEALNEGAFDVLDLVYELPRAVEFVRRALWTEYLNGSWPDLSIPDSRRAS